MKRLPVIFSLLAVIALSSSLAYWFLQLVKAPDRPIVAAPLAAAPEPSPDAAATLFGGQAVTVTASNYQLTGVLAAGRDSVAILVADGQPPKALKMGREVAPGVTVSEVHARHVMLSEGGVLKRIDLATDTKAGPNMAPPMTMQENSVPGQQIQNVQPPPQMTPQPPPVEPQAGQPPPPPPQVEMPAPTRTVVSPGGQPPTQ